MPLKLFQTGCKGVKRDKAKYLKMELTLVHLERITLHQFKGVLKMKEVEKTQKRKRKS